MHLILVNCSKFFTILLISNELFKMLLKKHEDINVKIFLHSFMKKKSQFKDKKTYHIKRIFRDEISLILNFKSIGPSNKTHSPGVIQFA